MTVNLGSFAKQPMATAASTIRCALCARILPPLQMTRHDNTTIHIAVGCYPADLVSSSHLSLHEIGNPICMHAHTQTLIARTLLSTTAWRAGLTTRASQTQTFVYCPSHPQNAACDAKLASKVSMAERELLLLPVT